MDDLDGNIRYQKECYLAHGKNSKTIASPISSWTPLTNFQPRMLFRASARHDGLTLASNGVQYAGNLHAVGPRGCVDLVGVHVPSALNK